MNSHNGHANRAMHERIDSIAGNLKAFVDQLSNTAAVVEHRASDVKARTVSTATSFAAQTSKAIQDHPIAAIGIAFGAGYLLMRLIRR
ncbi:MAG TPA: hypothetical protein VFK02_33185 [Kofleriaceae bacterium]|nr:hypothetical protein [Kofleriaceae bacterium]